MNELSIDIIKHRLQRYERSVQETSEHSSELTPFGRYRAVAPYEEKYGLSLLIKSLKPDDPHEQLLQNEFDRITLAFASFEQEKGREYRDHLWYCLVQYTDARYTALCWYQIGLSDIDADRDLFMRHQTEVLLKELRHDYHLAEIEQKIAVIDEAYRGLKEMVGKTMPDQSPACTKMGYPQGNGWKYPKKIMENE